jgi:hypothetical protein
MMRRTVFIDRRSFQMKTVISVEEATRRGTATYPLKRDATKKPLHPIVSMLSRNKKEENPTNGDTIAGVAYRRFDALVISSDEITKAPKL